MTTNEAPAIQPIKMRFFEGGTAPAAVAAGYKMNGTVHSTPEALMSQHGSEDLIFVYGASVHGKPGVFEFARFEPTYVPGLDSRLVDSGSAYGLANGLLVSAPLFTDGRADEDQWGPVEFGVIGDGEAAYCRLIKQALEAMPNRDH